jgi:hypothetical protein
MGIQLRALIYIYTTSLSNTIIVTSNSFDLLVDGTVEWVRIPALSFVIRTLF